MRTLTIIIPGLPPREASPNWSPRSGGHWAIRNRALKDWRDLVYFNALSARNQWERGQAFGVLWKPLAQAIITITFTVPDRRYIQDDANLFQTLKGAVDELTMPLELKGKRGAGVLVDDKPENLTWEKPVWNVVRGLDKRDMATRIEIREVGWKMNGG